MSEPRAKKSLGQHWLRDASTLAAMCDAADLTADDTVLEIGPGLGTLTELLVKRAHEVIAVEFDERLARELGDRLAANNLQIVSQDILSFDLTSLPPHYKVAANIPYYLTSNLIRLLSETPNPPQTIALLVQKEVAERVAAGPGAMSLLSVTAQFYWQVRLGQVVPAELFEPPPRVDSRILSMTRRPEPLFEVDTKKFFRLVKAGFAQRRKTLLNSLGGGLQLSRQETQKLLDAAGLEPSRRAQTLSLAEWHRLYRAWNT
ncbi:MAG TPA: 16S rRNA (adenine(1518)-N(6)/adenine(1519)-N(6))-dimethyltransferase RsmA [Candidatus Saccharimonadales bacterium]|nr:16S rRNA (adenine(1518)-N(6)/adenine(1519)-N(6))-dimethyltransferase RsmA [Candidatus Saccharimonadales bacterium]